jgi:histidyl-tRNA synthetase
MSAGDLVMSLVLEELGLIPEDIKSPSASVLVTVFDEGSMQETLRLSDELRQTGLKVNCYPQADKLSKQLKFADRIGIKIAVILGPEEIKQDMVTFKELSSGNQVSVDRALAADTISELLDGYIPS